MEIEEKRKKVIVKREERPSIEVFVQLFYETKGIYTELYEITSNRDYMSYLSRRFRFLADTDECQHKIQDIRKHLDDNKETWDVEREVYYLKILRISESRLKRLLENPILENSTFEEFTIRKNQLIIEINSRLERIKTTWGLEIPIYLLQKDNPDQVLFELRERGYIA
jgi:hypothetical protein